MTLKQQTKKVAMYRCELKVKSINCGSDWQMPPKTNTPTMLMLEFFKELGISNTRVLEYVAHVASATIDNCEHVLKFAINTLNINNDISEEVAIALFLYFRNMDVPLSTQSIKIKFERDGVTHERNTGKNPTLREYVTLLRQLYQSDDYLDEVKAIKTPSGFKVFLDVI